MFGKFGKIALAGTVLFLAGCAASPPQEVSVGRVVHVQQDTPRRYLASVGVGRGATCGIEYLDEQTLAEVTIKNSMYDALGDPNVRPGKYFMVVPDGTEPGSKILLVEGDTKDFSAPAVNVSGGLRQGTINAYLSGEC